MGVAAFRVVGSGSSTSSVADPSGSSTGQADFAVGGDRIFVDATSIVRSAVGREIMPRALDVMEARSAVVLHGLFGDPRFSVLRGPGAVSCGRPFVSPYGSGCPFVVAQALFIPSAAQRRVRRLADEVRTGDVPPGGDIATRVDGVVDLLFDAMPLAPRSLPGAAVGFAMLGLAGRMLRGSTRYFQSLKVGRQLHHSENDLRCSLMEVFPTHLLSYAFDRQLYKYLQVTLGKEVPQNI